MPYVYMLEILLIVLVIYKGPYAMPLGAEERDYLVITKWGSKGAGYGELQYPIEIDVDSSNNIYVIEQGSIGLQQFTRNRTIRPSRLKVDAEVEDSLLTLEDIEFDQSTILYITKCGNHNIHK